MRLVEIANDVLLFGVSEMCVGINLLLCSLGCSFICHSIQLDRNRIFFQLNLVIILLILVFIEVKLFGRGLWSFDIGALLASTLSFLVLRFIRIIGFKFWLRSRLLVQESSLVNNHLRAIERLSELELLWSYLIWRKQSFFGILNWLIERYLVWNPLAWVKIKCVLNCTRLNWLDWVELAILS